MRVTVLDNNGVVTRYLFDPAHYVGIGEFYSRLTQEGKIRTYTIFLDN
jgi:hypothetical protein